MTAARYISMTSRLAHSNRQAQLKTKIQNPWALDFGLSTRLRRAARRIYSLRWKVAPPNYNRTYSIRSNGFNITVLPSVFHPRWHFTSEFFAEVCATLIPRHGDCNALDIGTGTGLVALSAARRADRVVAVDINPAAAKCARINAANNGMANKIEVYEGDMFGPAMGRKFDIILCNPPYFRGNVRSEADLAYMAGPNLEWLSRLASEAHDYLSKGGSLACVFGDAANVPSLVALITEKGWTGRVVARRKSLLEELTVWKFESNRDQGSGIRE